MQNAPFVMQEALPYPVFALETRFRIPSFDDKSIAYLSKKRQAMTTLLLLIFFAALPINQGIVLSSVKLMPLDQHSGKCIQTASCHIPAGSIC